MYVLVPKNVSEVLLFFSFSPLLRGSLFNLTATSTRAGGLLLLQLVVVGVVGVSVRIQGVGLTRVSATS